MKYIKKKLDNGMIVILAPMKSTNIISVGFFVKAGAVNETEDNNGIAHFLEHMVFKGTTSRPSNEIFHQLDMLGVEYNAVTTMETTHYYMYGNYTDAKKIIDVALDIYINPLFETKSINKEKSVIIEEMRMRSDIPYMQLHTALLSKMFKSTPYSKNIIGDEKTIKKFVRKDFVAFRNETYRPDSTVFVIAGNFNPTMIFNMIERPLAKLENPSNAISIDSFKTIIDDNMKDQMHPYVHLKNNSDAQQVYLLLGFPLFDLYDKYGKEIDLLGHVLTSGLSSRLFNSLRIKKGITYSSMAYPYVYSDGGVFVIKSVMNPNNFIEGLKIIFRELRKLKKDEIGKDELKKVKNIAINNTLFSTTTPMDYLTYYGLNFVSDHDADPDIERDVKQIKRTKSHAIQELAKKIFTKSKINLYLYGNVEERDFSFIRL